MVVFQEIIACAQRSKKNILVIGSPRSGTHPLAAELNSIVPSTCLGEICKVLDRPDSWNEIRSLYKTDRLTIGQIVQLTPKIHLARNILEIKDHVVVVNIRRRDKVKQFASYVYFRLQDPTEIKGWHNHHVSHTKIPQFSIEAKENDLIQFMLEQIVDDYFLPDFNLCYEDLKFTQALYRKNEFAFPLETIFSNLDFVKSYLDNWQYHKDHLDT